MTKNDNWHLVQLQTEKVNITMEFCIFKLVLVPNFSLSWHCFFLGQICPKRAFWVKNRKSHHLHWFLYIRIRHSAKFQLKLIALIFMAQICSKRAFLERRKSGHHHWVLHTRIILGTKFQLKLKTLIFWTNFQFKFQTTFSSWRFDLHGILDPFLFGGFCLGYFWDGPILLNHLGSCLLSLR